MSKDNNSHLLQAYSKSDLYKFIHDAVVFTKTTHEEFFEELSNVGIESLTPEKFLAEFTWVVMSSGFDPKIVYQKYPRIVKTLSKFCLPQIQRGVVKKGMKIIAHKQKWESIFACADLLKRTDWEEVKEKYLSSIGAMEKLPRIGPVTKYHLARNIRYDFVRPSKILDQVTEKFGIESPEILCKHVQTSYQEFSDLTLSQLDYAIWCFVSHDGIIQECCLPTDESID